MKNHLVEITKYNLWANQKIVELLNVHPNELIVQKIENSFPSLQKTMEHIWAAEQIWLTRLKGISLASLPKLEGEIEDQFKLGLKVSENYMRYVEEKDEGFLGSNCDFTDTKGTNYSIPVQKIIHHTMNHSTYHRGQIITLGRQLGFKNLESTDFITYVRL